MSKKFISGLVLGVAVGATAAILLAPKKGEELREDLSDKAEDLKAIGLDYLELLTVKGEELINKTVHTAQTLVEKVQNGEVTEMINAVMNQQTEQNEKSVVEESIEEPIIVALDEQSVVLEHTQENV